MLDRDKLYITFYVDVSGIDSSDIPEYMNDIMDNLNKANDGSVVFYVIPVNTGEPTRVEYHWPPYIPEPERKLSDNIVETIEEIKKENNNF